MVGRSVGWSRTGDPWRPREGISWCCHGANGAHAISHGLSLQLPFTLSLFVSLIFTLAFLFSLSPPFQYALIQSPLRSCCRRRCRRRCPSSSWSSSSSSIVHGFDSYPLRPARELRGNKEENLFIKDLRFLFHLILFQFKKENRKIRDAALGKNKKKRKDHKRNLQKFFCALSA